MTELMTPERRKLIREQVDGLKVIPEPIRRCIARLCVEIEADWRKRLAMTEIKLVDATDLLVDARDELDIGTQTHTAVCEFISRVR
jgi:hypothetical protein